MKWIYSLMTALVCACGMSDEPQHSPLEIENQTSIILTGMVEDGRLHTMYGPEPMENFGGVLIVRVYEGETVDITLEPFEQDGERFHLHAMSPGDGGDLISWPHDEHGRPTIQVQPPTDVEFVLVAVSADGSRILADDYPLVDVDPMDM